AIPYSWDRLSDRAESRPASRESALHRDCSDARESRRRAQCKYLRLTRLGPFVSSRKSSYGFSQPPVAWIGGAVSADLIQAASAVGLSVSTLVESETVPVHWLPSFTMSILAKCSTTKL